MTRMAPRPSAVQRSDSARPAAPIEATPAPLVGRLAWRVGRSGTLSVILKGAAGSHELVASVELVADSRAPGSASRAPREVLSGQAALVAAADCFTLSLRLRREASANPVVTTITVVSVDVDGPAVILTSLPAQLGLKGGTYALEQREADALCSALRAHAACSG